MQHKKILVSFLVVVGLSFSFMAKAAQHKVGSLIKDQNGTIFLVTTENGQTVRRAYFSSDVFLSYGFNKWSQVSKASKQDLNLPVGSQITPQDGQLFCASPQFNNPICSYYLHGQVYSIQNGYVLNDFGLKYLTIKNNNFVSIPFSGNIASSTFPHPPGSLITFSDSKIPAIKDIFLVGAEGLYTFSNKQIFLSWGYNISQVIKANNFDGSFSVIGKVEMRKAGELNFLDRFSGPMFVRAAIRYETLVPNSELPIVATPLPSVYSNNSTINSEFNYLTVQTKDAKRLADVRQIATAMELFFNDNNRYPYNLADLWPKYIYAIPLTPAPADGICTQEQNNYNYKNINNYSYEMTFCLGEQTGGYAAGLHTLTQAGITENNYKSFPSYQTNTQQSNDALRLAQIRQLASALELYFGNFNRYPYTLTELAPNYIGIIPQAPAITNGLVCSQDQNNYQYTYLSYNSYKITFCFESNISGYSPGIKTLTPAGIEDTSKNSNFFTSQLTPESKELVAKIGKLILLPINEDPAVLKIEDINKLKDQSSFFENAQNGDYLLIFPKNQLGIIYRPSTNIIVKSGPLIK